jgi:hypothetical protein
MEIKENYTYHIKDEYFIRAKDLHLMQNKEQNNYRPTYFALKDNQLLWMIPISSKYEKYERIYETQKIKYKECITLVLGIYGGKKTAFLLQNMFPITSYYIDHVHTVQGNPLPVNYLIQQQILNKYKRIKQIHAHNKKIIFTDIDRLEKLMLNELPE